MEVKKEDGGWQFAFLCEIDHDFICIICLLPMRDPHQISSCGHSMCETCLEKVICRDPICPQDRKPFKRSAIFPDLKCNRKIMALKMKCPFSVSGCKWHGELIDFLKNHSDKCLKEPVPCTMTPCTAQPTREELPLHLEHECEWRIIICEYCSDEIIFCQILDHLENDCCEYPIICKNICGLSVPKRKMESHLKECQHRFVQCQYHQVGCIEEIMSKDIALHMESNAGRHTDHFFAAFLNEKNKNKVKTEELKEENRNLRDSLEMSKKDNQNALKMLKKDNQNALKMLKKDNQDNLHAVEKLKKDHQDALGKLKKDNQDALEKLKKNHQDALGKLKSNFDTILQISIGDIEPGFVEFVWHIQDFQLHWKRLQEDKSDQIRSPTYQTGLKGYHFCLEIKIRLDDDLDDSYFSISMRVIQGPHDNILTWPYEPSSEITLINCKKEKYLTEDWKSNAFSKPERLLGNGYYHNFVKRSELLNDGYIINDSVFIKLKLPKFSKK